MMEISKSNICGKVLLLIVAAGTLASAAAFKEDCSVMADAYIASAQDSGFPCFKFSGYAKDIYYTAQGPIEKGSSCELAVVHIHGWGGGLKVEREVPPLCKALAKACGVEPYVISPLFPRRDIMHKEKVAYDGRAVWNDSWGRDLSIPGSPADDWRGGGDASGTEISSFAVVDDVLAALGDRSRFPNLRRVVMTGYSAGGQFVGRYVATGKGGVRDGVTLEYVAMAPSTELWLNGNVRWHYGLKDRPRYSEHLTEGQILANLSSRRVWRGCGKADVKGMPITSLDSCPEAMAQGANRYERFRNFEKYLKRYPSWAKQVSFHAFENLGHQGNVAYADPALIEFISGVGQVDKRGEFRGIRDYPVERSSVTNVILRCGEGSALDLQ